MASLRSHRHLRLLFLCNAFLVIRPASSFSATDASMSPISSAISTSAHAPKLISISEKVWRKAASNHSARIKSLLLPGLTSLDHPLNLSKRKGQGQGPVDEWTALDPINPIYNFLIEYYGLKGLKGPRRLARWSPDPRMLLDNDHREDVHDHGETSQCTISSAGSAYEAAMEASHGLGGILLENAGLDDLGGTLHLRGSVPVPINATTFAAAAAAALSSSKSKSKATIENEEQLHGILYNPAVFYNRHLNIQPDDERRLQLTKTLAPFQWYSSILRTTLASDPILHCYGLHEWAMQYHPEGADPPPSAKYQSGLTLRVSRETINAAVERKGVRCTHVDALRFFAPAAGPLNHHGSQLERTDQLRLEQKGCVHAHMDLLKICLKLGPFVDATLLQDVLEISLAARTLDVEASPYDATAFGAGIVPIETNEGRKMYRDRQIGLMQRAEPVRERLLEAYDAFARIAFDEDGLVDGGGAKKKTTKVDNGMGDTDESGPYVAPERLAVARPGGLP